MKIAMAKQRGDVVGLDERASTAAATGSVVDVEQGSAGHCGERPQLCDRKRHQAGRRPATDVRSQSHGEREHKPNTTKPSEACCARLACGMQAKSAPSHQLAHVGTSNALTRKMRQDSSVRSNRVTT